LRFLSYISSNLAYASILTYCAKSMTTVPMYAYAWTLLVFAASLSSAPGQTVKMANLDYVGADDHIRPRANVVIGPYNTTEKPGHICVRVSFTFWNLPSGLPG